MELRVVFLLLVRKKERSEDRRQLAPLCNGHSGHVRSQIGKMGVADDQRNRH